MREIIKCGQDPGYFLKTYTKIQHPRKGLIPFETYPFQDECLAQFRDNRFNIVLKSRQLGLSTITAGYCAWMGLFYRAKDILVLATKLSTAQEFTRKVKVMLDSVPRNLLLTGYSYTKTAITFENGSIITAVPTSQDVGRSNSLSLLIVDECVHHNEKITVRNKTTGEILNISIGEFYDMLNERAKEVSATNDR